MATRYVNTGSTLGGDGTTNLTTGSTRAFPSLNAWEAARQATLTEIEKVWCTGGATADTTSVAIDGWTTDSSNYIDIEVDPADRHAGAWTNFRYRIEASIDGPVIGVEENYTRLTGLQLFNTYATAGDHGPAVIRGIGTDCRFEKIIGKGTLNGSDFPDGIGLNANCVAINCIIYDTYNSTSVRGRGFYRVFSSAGAKAYNCTVQGVWKGYQDDDDGTATHMLVKNCLAYGCVDGFAASNIFAVGSDYNASDLASDAPGTNSRNSQTYTFMYEGIDDFRLSVFDAGAKGFGVADPSSGLFSDSIEGATRGATWDIGASQWSASRPRQAVSGSGGSGAGSDVKTVTLPNATTTGNGLIVGIAWYQPGATTFSSLADNKSNSFTQIGSQLNLGGGSSVKVRLYRCESITGGSNHQVTLTMTGTGTYPTLVVMEVPTPDTALDVTVGQESALASVSPTSGATSTRTEAAELLVGFMANGSTASIQQRPGGVFGMLTGSNFEDGTAGIPCALDYMQVSAVGTDAATFVLGTSIDWGVIAASFKTYSAPGQLITLYFRRRR